MTGEEAQKILDELNTVRIEVLNDEEKRLFEAIMKIADERDKIKQEYDRDTHILQNQLDLADVKNIEKDKIIEQQKEQIDYLRRSCDRKENSLIEEQQENVDLESNLRQKDKIIDLMSKEILKLDIKRASIIYDSPRIWETEKGIKQHFENKAKGE